MKHLLSGAIGATLGAITMLMFWPGADCHEERTIITALSQRNDKAQWEAKRAAHQLAKTQRELGAQLAQKVGKIDDVMPIRAVTVSKVDEEVASITALAKSLTAMEAEARKDTALIDPNPAPRSWWHWVKSTSFRLAAGRW
jgi:gas vesicle protein